MPRLSSMPHLAPRPRGASMSPVSARGTGRAVPPLLLALCLFVTAPSTLAHRKAARPDHEPMLPSLPALAPLGARPAAPGDGDVHVLADGRWLVARDGALTLVSRGRESRLVSGSFESIDARDGVAYEGRDHVLVALIDADAGEVVVLILDAETATVRAQQRIVAPRALAEVACLHREPATGHVALLTVDARGMLEQRYVFDAASGELLDLPVRQEVAVLDAEACAVDDASGTLFLAEGPLGVWQLPVSAESDAIRTPVMLRKPWGDVDGEIEDLAVDASGTLWALLADEGLLLRRGAGTAHGYRLPPGTEMAGVAVRAGVSQTEVAFFDESQGSVGTAALPGGADPATAAPPAADRVPAAAETAPVRRYGDAADDPAIYVPSDPAGTPLILGTDKREGLAVYNLDGELLQMLPVGRVNNVDLLTGVTLGDATRDIAAASNRSNNSIALFEVVDGRVGHLGDLPTSLDEVYGLCMYGSTSGAYVFINDKDGRYQQYRLAWRGEQPDARLVREFRLPSQPEGCVADAEAGRLYMGEEAAGIWETAAEPDGAPPRRIISLSDALVADVEGMDIYRRGTGEAGKRRLLVVSSQGSDSYAVYDLDDEYRLVAAFSIAADLAAGIDGVSETDGLAVSAAALPGYPRGMLVVQDGRNRMPDAPQNFKIVDWRAIEALLP